MLNKTSFWKRNIVSLFILIVMVGMILLNVFLPNFQNKNFISGRGINSALISALILLAVIEMRRAFGFERIPHCFSWLIWLFGFGIGPCYSFFGFHGIVFMILFVFICAVFTALIRNRVDSLVFIASVLIYPGLIMSSLLYLNRCATNQVITNPQMLEYISYDIWWHVSDYRYQQLLPYNAISMAFVFAVSCFTDAFAYVVGSIFGKHKLCPEISPKKTVEGAVGGVLGGLLGSFVVWIFFDSPLGILPEQFGLSFVGLGLSNVNVAVAYVSLGLLGSIMTQLGDLLASMFKRYCGIKDYSRILGEHGGIMDRFDGIMLNSLLVSSVLIFIV